MIHVLPVSRCAPYLRDADFLTIFEKTLEESFGTDATIQPVPVPHDRHPRDVSDSSETVYEDPQPSRKRKRGSSGTSTPSKRAAGEEPPQAELFEAATAVVRSVRDRASSHESGEKAVQGEHMKMVLKTETAQVARILKYWLNATQKLVQVLAGQIGSNSAGFLDLTPVMDIWDLRSIDKDGSGPSTEQFSTECLIPALILSETLRAFALEQQNTPESLQYASQALDRLFARHILAPSRAAFFNDASTETAKEGGAKRFKAELLSTNLAPLRAKLLQAAQIEDAGQPMPTYFNPLFAAIPQLLDLAIRSSPARTPRSRIAEKPWIQAVFVALVECAGCSLEPPEFVTPRASIVVVERSLQVLASHDISIDSEIIKDLLWFHSGLEFPLKQKRVVHWSLVAALIDLDAGIFVPDSRSSPSTSGGRPNDLAEFLFEQISATTFNDGNRMDDDKMVVDGPKDRPTLAETHGKEEHFGREAVAGKIVIPIMSAFARNRNLTGFLGKWDTQLCKIAQDDRRPLKELTPPIWQDRGLANALAGFFEQSLTPTQISKLFREHSKRLEPEIQADEQESAAPDFSAEAFSSAVLIQAMLGSVRADETIEAVHAELLSLWKSYALRVQYEHRGSASSLGLSWMTLSQLLIALWPTHFHGSSSSQQELLYPLIDQASRDVVGGRKDQTEVSVDSYSRSTALAFMFTACDCLRALPDTKELIRKKLRKALKSLSPGQLRDTELIKMTEIFCAEYAQLLECFERDACQASLSGLLSSISKFDNGFSEQTSQALSQCVFAYGSVSLQASYMTALLKALTQDDKRLRTLVIDAFLQLTPSSISRELREAALDKITDMLASGPEDVNALLSIMVHLMEVPNATAKVSSEGSILFDVAQRLHDGQLETPSSLSLLLNLARLTLRHIIPNKDQEQNKRFLETYGSKIVSVTKKTRRCFPARLAVLRGTLLATHKEGMLLTAGQFVSLLVACLEEETASHEHILEAFNDIPFQTLRSHEDIFQNAQASLRAWIESREPLRHLLSTPCDATLPAVPSTLWPCLHTTLARYRLYPDTKQFIHFSVSLLHEPLTAKDKVAILNAVREVLLPLPHLEKLALATVCTQSGPGSDPASPYRILATILATFEDKQGDDATIREQQLALLPKVCTLLGKSPNHAACNALLDGVNTIIRDKPSLTTQYSIECVLTVLVKLVSRHSSRLSTEHAPTIFGRLCETSRMLLLLHRGRLGGRFHLLLPLLQNLLFCLFIPNAGRHAALPPWLQSTRLTPANASQYTRVLSTLCSPTQSSVQRPSHHSRSAGSKKELNDPVKAAREYASQYVYPLLSSFCRFQLNGRLDPQVREKLMPGIREVVGVGAMDRAGLDAMFAGLDTSTRDVWRGLWAEWLRANGRREPGRDGA